MKKILLGLCAILGLINMTGCSSDEKYPMPTTIDQNSLSAEAKAGAIKLKWTVPADSNYYYVKVTYTLPEDGKKCLRLASVKSDTMLVDNLLHRYGDIDFTLQPCNRAGEGSQSCSITARALPAPKQIKTDRSDVTLSAKQLYTDDQESSEGPIANLIDGKNDTYFHMSWSSPTPFPHYIVVDLGEENALSTFLFSYVCRDNNNKDNPKEIDILGSNTFDGKNYDESQTTLLASLSDLPNTKAASYESDIIKAGASYRYLWFKVKSSTSGSNWIALAELALSKVIVKTYDPETGETTTE